MLNTQSLASTELTPDDGIPQSSMDRPSCTNEGLPLNIPYRPSFGSADGLSSAVKALYRPLETSSFRLVYLHDRLEQGLLRCSFQHAHLPTQGSDVHFTAISYTWSTSDRFWYGRYDTSPKPIILDGKHVLVSDKVANILYLMQQTNRRSIWIDALCINQEDNAEKGIQVAQMHLIYGLATEVCVMLGSPNARIDRFLDSVKQGNITDIVAKYIYNYTDAERKAWRKTIGWIGFSELARNIYWRRAWILQEIMLGNKIILFSGTRFVDFAELCESIGQMRQILDYRLARGDLASFFGSAVRVRSKASLTWVAWAKSAKDHFPNRQMPKAPVLELLRVTRGWNQCRDPRDMLYSKLAMATDLKELIQKPDYDSGLSNVFRDFATAHIKLSGTVEIIAFATPTRTNLGMPSWVPDWTSKSKDWRPLICSKIPSLVYPEVTCPPYVSSDGSELVVRGRTVGKVSATLLRNLERLIDNSGSVDFAFGVPAHLWWNSDEVPRKGDLICLLQGFSTFAYLRPSGQRYRLVGRNELCQNWILGGKFEFYGLLAWRGLHRDPQHYLYGVDRDDPQVLKHALSCAEVEFRIE